MSQQCKQGRDNHCGEAVTIALQIMTLPLVSVIASLVPSGLKAQERGGDSIAAVRETSSIPESTSQMAT